MKWLQMVFLRHKCHLLKPHMCYGPKIMQCRHLRQGLQLFDMLTLLFSRRVKNYISVCVLYPVRRLQSMHCRFHVPIGRLYLAVPAFSALRPMLMYWSAVKPRCRKTKWRESRLALLENYNFWGICTSNWLYEILSPSKILSKNLEKCCVRGTPSVQAECWIEGK